MSRRITNRPIAISNHTSWRFTQLTLLFENEPPDPTAERAWLRNLPEIHGGRSGAGDCLKALTGIWQNRFTGCAVGPRSIFFALVTSTESSPPSGPVQAKTPVSPAVKGERDWASFYVSSLPGLVRRDVRGYGKGHFQTAHVPRSVVEDAGPKPRAMAWIEFRPTGLCDFGSRAMSCRRAK
jgi:hypothetical protein